MGFEVAPNEPPYHGVRGQGEAGISERVESRCWLSCCNAILAGLTRPGNWLLSRGPDELLISIEPLRWFSWDYRERMAEIAAPVQPARGLVESSLEAANAQ